MDKSYKYGVIAGLFSGITWALYTIINNLITKNIIFNSYIEKMFIPVLVIVFLHDFFSSIWLFFYLWRKRKLFELKRTIKSKNMFLIFFRCIIWWTHRYEWLSFRNKIYGSILYSFIFLHIFNPRNYLISSFFERKNKFKDDYSCINKYGRNIYIKFSGK